MPVEFTLNGHAYRAWYTENESHTRYVLRVSTKGRPTKEEYAAAREHAAELLKDIDDLRNTTLDR